MRKKSAIASISAALAAAAALAGCSGGGGHDMSNMAPSTAAPAPATTAGQADITFAQQMIPHHAGALDMARMVPGRTSNPQVLDLAGRIERAQEPEIRQLTGWLQAWGAQVPSTGHGMEHGGMPGMMSHDEMNRLMAGKDAEFDTMFLEMMIQHHQGAIDMSRTELAQGGNADAKALAQRIIDAQQAEIDEMRRLLGQS